MSCSLQETLSQIDRFVNFSDGSSIHSVSHWLGVIDPDDATEYILCVDSIGRLLIHQIDFASYMVFPPVLVEEKPIDRQLSSVGFITSVSPPTSPSHYV